MTAILETMSTTIKDNTLTIVIALNPDGPPSSTGKTQIAASSHGYQPVGDSPYILSLNVLKKRLRQ